MGMCKLSFDTGKQQHAQKIRRQVTMRITCPKVATGMQEENEAKSSQVIRQEGEYSGVYALKEHTIIVHKDCDTLILGIVKELW